MALDPLTAALEIGGKVLDKLFPDPIEREKAEYALWKLKQDGQLAQLSADTTLATGQLEVNKAEASSGNTYASSWRPTVGYVCIAGLGYTFILQPLLPWIAALCGATVPPLPALDTDVLMTLLLGMLGIGGLRSFDKTKGVASR